MKYINKEELVKFSKKVIENQKLKQKETFLQTNDQTVRTRLFRSDDLTKNFQEKTLDELNKKFSLNITSLAQFIDLLLDSGVLMRLQRENENFKGEKLKWPKKVEFCPIQKFDASTINFFSFTRRDKVRSWKAYAIVIAVLLVFLYPTWPFSFRVFMFYICFYLSILFILFQIVRFLIYYFYRLLGYEFWILPNINENQISLKPIYTFTYCNDKLFGILARIFCFISTIIIFVLISSKTQNREDIKYFLHKSHDDMLTYGLEKIKFNYTFDSSRSISFESLLEESDENVTSSINFTHNNSESSLNPLKF